MIKGILLQCVDPVSCITSLACVMPYHARLVRYCMTQAARTGIPIPYVSLVFKHCKFGNVCIYKICKVATSWIIGSS